MAYKRIVLSFVNVLRCKVGFIFTHKKIIPDLSHGLEGVHMKIGEITHRWLAFPHALTLSELLHQVLIIRVSKKCSILGTIVIQQAVNPVDDLGTKLDPLASDENGGANFERKIRGELPHERGHSKD